MKSFIYVISNKVNQDISKIGICEETPETVVRDLDSTGASPFPYKLEYKALVDDAFLILQAVRRLLWAELKNIGSGWFYIPVEEIICLIRHEISQAIVDKYMHETRTGSVDNGFVVMLKYMDDVLPFYDDTLSRKNDLQEAVEVSRHITQIMRYEYTSKKKRGLGITLLSTPR